MKKSLMILMFFSASAISCSFGGFGLGLNPNNDQSRPNQFGLIGGGRPVSNNLHNHSQQLAQQQQQSFMAAQSQPAQQQPFDNIFNFQQAPNGSHVSALTYNKMIFNEQKALNPLLQWPTGDRYEADFLRVFERPIPHYLAQSDTYKEKHKATYDLIVSLYTIDQYNEEISYHNSICDMINRQIAMARSEALRESERQRYRNR